MRSDVLHLLRDAQTFGELAQALSAFCEPYGQIHSLLLTHNKRAGTVSCVIEMDSAKQQPALKHALGAAGYGGSGYPQIPGRDDFAPLESGPGVGPALPTRVPPADAPPPPPFFSFL